MAAADPDTATMQEQVRNLKMVSATHMRTAIKGALRTKLAFHCPVFIEQYRQTALTMAVNGS